MKVLVTGATGVYGRSVVARLIRAGHEVVAMARNPPASLPAGVRFAQGDVADARAVRSAMEGCDAVAHLAWVVTPMKSEEDTRKINLGGTQNVLDAMEATGARRLVFSSSAMSYGARPDNPPRFTEEHEQRPTPEYVYGRHKKLAEQLIIDSGVDAVLARPGVTVGRNIDNLILDIFSGPAVIGIKGLDINWQFVHQDDVGRFLALACEEGPAGPVNLAAPDLLPLREIARQLGKRFVEISEQQLLTGVEFAWRHDLAAVTPGDASGISYLPLLDTTRLEQEWGFTCAWSTAETVIDLRRAIHGILSVAKRRIEIPGRLRYPQQAPGDQVSDVELSGSASAVLPPGELDCAGSISNPTYVRVTRHESPLTPLTLTTYHHVLRAAAIGALDAFATPAPDRTALAATAAGVFGHRLFVNESISRRQPTRALRRVLALRFPAEVDALDVGSRSLTTRALLARGHSDDQVEVTLAALRDELGWVWAAIRVGRQLADLESEELDGLIFTLPDGAALAALAGGTAAAPSRSRRRADLARAEQIATRLGHALAACVAERARRLTDADTLADAGDAAFLTWDELIQPPAGVRALVAARRREHERLLAMPSPSLLAITNPDSAVATGDRPATAQESAHA